MASQFQLHCERWKAGCGSDRCGKAGRVVLARGQIPCDVLFVGEAPGVSEDVLGRPFCGPAGILLDRIVAAAFGDVLKVDGTRLRAAFTNVVGCIPLDEHGNKTDTADEDQIQQCKPRLEEFIHLANPRLIVAVGAEARDALKQGFKRSVTLPKGVKVVDVTHPAAVLRANVAQQGLLIQRCEAVLSTAAADLV